MGIVQHTQNPWKISTYPHAVLKSVAFIHKTPTGLTGALVFTDKAPCSVILIPLFVDSLTATRLSCK